MKYSHRAGDVSVMASLSQNVKGDGDRRDAGQRNLLLEGVFVVTEHVGG